MEDEQNSIIINSSFNETELSQYIQDISNEIGKKYTQDLVNANGKILLNNPSNPSMYFFIEFLGNTTLNPFSNDIIFGIELQNNMVPYVRILTDFTEPSFNDNRNMYYCLNDEHDYKYNNSYKDVAKKNILKTVDNIPDFFQSLKENLQIEAFVYYGDYEIDKIYMINDFLLNSSYIRFYRVIDLNTKNKDEKYIVITQLYLLVFIPDDNDKSLAKLITYKKLNDCILTMDDGQFHKSLNKHSATIKFSDDKKIKFEIIVINKRPQVLRTNEENEYINEFLDMSKIVDQRVKEFNDKKYKYIINGYKLLINHRFSEDHQMLIQLEEYDKLISYCEALYEYNKNNDTEKGKKRIQFFIDNISFLCSEIMGLKDAKMMKYDDYLEKMKKYLNLFDNYEVKKK